MRKDTQLEYIEISKILKIIFNTLLALLILICCLPIVALIVIHYFIKSFVSIQIKKNESSYKHNSRIQG